MLGKTFSEKLWTGGPVKKEILYMLGKRGLLSTQECRRKKRRISAGVEGSEQKKLELRVNRL